ncbi:polysaccharide biosynthesis tyrosine autokinase [Iamia sp. SCSIO 61187]|uniref:polysaccharide biosynthesis tyrosine autokinase n=1 Tax=Iamia sp. SCSIO 61187 TaxID=2722752 RepID=UPI001C63A749|nr:polysaccharide biosynthesis tyrosine autokinase [Iamia sp. SCSIO 61187]QYG92344.1 polysaccharide biosynthesis tyrosine autokinase [Iamia sp. SCSIO 61187]
MIDPREPDELELRDYLAVLNRRRLTIALTTLIVVVLALVYSFLQTPTYRATAEVLLQGENAEDLLSGSENQAANSQTLQSRVLTEIEVMRSRSVRDAVRDELGYVPSVSISQKGETAVVSLSATDTEPERAAEEVNVFASTFIDLRRNANVSTLEEAIAILTEQVSSLDTQLDEADAVVEELDAQIATADPAFVDVDALTRQRDQAIAERDAARLSLQTQRAGYAEQLGQLQLSLNAARTGGGEVVSEATVPGSPFAPDPFRNAAVALVLGLLLGAGLAFLREYLDDRIRSKDDVDATTGGTDVLGLIPKVETWRNRSETQLVSMSAPKSSVAEAYRALRTSLQFIGVDRPLRLIQVTSASASEGKTTTLANLGVALARAGHRVIVVDCDLRRPRLHQFFGLDNHVGLTSIILGERDFEHAIQPVPEVPRLAVLASGPPPPNPSELLSTRSAQALLGSLADHADYVLIDSPPLLPVADSVIIARTVDATVLVTTVGSTTKRNLRRSLELLDQVDAPLVGVVLNGLEAEDAYAYAYGYGYYGQANGSPDHSAGRGLFSRRRGVRSHASAAEVAAAPLPSSEEDVYRS